MKHDEVMQWEWSGAEEEQRRPGANGCLERLRRTKEGVKESLREKREREVR